MMMMDGMGAWGCSSGVSSVRSGVGNSRRNRHTDSCMEFMEFRRGGHDSVGRLG
jgi:hypothetical protein